MTEDPRYAQVNAMSFPPITRAEAKRAAQRLLDHFGLPRLGSARQIVPASIHYECRRCWISPRQTTSHHKGWGRLIHDISHVVFSARHPGFRSHDAGHSQLEAEMAAYVVSKGWLEGRLKDREVPRLSIAQRRMLKLSRLEQRIENWQRKQRRAHNALTKLKRQHRALLRTQERITAMQESVS